MFAKSSKMLYSSKHSNFAIFLRGNMMDEMYQVMQEMEQRLEKALENVETVAMWDKSISQDDIDVIRAACGKPTNKRNTLLQSVFEDFGNIFGGNHASI